MLYCNRNTGSIYWACIYCSIQVRQGSPVFSVTCVQQPHSCAVCITALSAPSSLPDLWDN